MITGGEDGTFIASKREEAEITGTVTKVTVAIYAFGTLWTLATLVGALSPWLFG